MNRVRLLAACAALSLVVAACGDDDDASGDTTIAPAVEATTADTADAGATATSLAASPSLPGGDASPEVVADCQAVVTAGSGVVGEEPDAPAVGEEISDEYKDFVESVRDTLEDIDLETDEVQAAVDEQIDFANDILDADEWTEELQTQGENVFAPLTEVCAATFATSATGS